MSETAQHGNSFDATERRQHSRYQTASLAYLDIGSDNGGIILNISEGGVAVQAMGVLPAEPVVDLRIQVPRSTNRLAARGKIAWTSGSKKEAGMEFVDLPEEAHRHIKDWLSSEISLQHAAEATSPEDIAQTQPLPAPRLQPAAVPLPIEPPIARVAPPAESIPKRVTDLGNSDVDPVLTFGPAARELEPRISRRVVAACVMVVIVGIGLGIAIVRSAFEPVPNVASSGNGVPPAGSLPVATEPQNSWSLTPAAPPDLGAHNRTDSPDARPTHKRSLRAVPLARRKVGIKAPPAPSAVPAGESAQAATTGSESVNSTATPAEASPSPNHVPVPPIPPVPSPDSRGSVPLARDTTPATQQPADRLLPSHLIYSFYPVYPRDALQQGVEGTVVVHATVEQNGTVKNLRVVSGPALLTSAALDAAQYWRYIPALRNGRPYETETDISIDFHLPH